ncbi:hypothetical protein BGX28_007169 [Mortierella sp. GBA30]|nr:hypothetical protein BGX28_007169 [Mortierella sp. GBA30]
MAPDKNYNASMTDAASEPQNTHSNNNNNNNNNNNSNSRSIFSVTMDPNALEQELDQAAQALHSTVNSLLNTMQSSVFGGLETLSREMSALEQSGKTFLEDHPLHEYHHRFPWSFRTDGPKKRYRITIEELPPLEQNEKDLASSKVFTASTGSDPSSPSNTSTKTLVKGASDGEDFTISQGKVGTADEGKTVITASVAPGLLDWLLFTTHEDSFFRRLGQKHHEHHGEKDYDVIGGTMIEELDDDLAHEEEKAKKRVVPALVEKVKQVGTHWEQDAKQWWKSKAQRSEEAKHSTNFGEGEELDRQHHLFSGVGQSESDQDEERHSRRWPRGRSWGRSESYSQTTVTRPDGTVEHRTVNSINGETETIVKIQHPDGSVEETVTRHNERDRQGPYDSFRDRWAHRRQNQYLYEGEEDRERDAVAAVVAEAIAAEKDTAAAGTQADEQQQTKSRSWPPKAWLRRNERD